MGRISFFVMMLFVAMAMNAQVNMNDSTVQVVAYWNVGDSYKYKYTAKSYVVEKSDTIMERESTDLFTLTVTDSTANNYILEYKSLDSNVKVYDESKAELMEKMSEIGKGIVVKMRMCNMGSYEDIVNWTEVDSVMSVAIDKAVDYFVAKVDESQRGVFRQTFEGIFGSLRNKEALIQGLEYLISPFYYHAAKLDLGRDYSSDTRLPSLWDNNTLVDVNETFYVSYANPESSWAGFRNITRYNSDQLFASFLNNMKENMKEVPDIDKLSDNPERPYVFIETEMNHIIHTGFGWPGEVTCKKVSRVGERQKVEEWVVKLID